MTTIQHTKVQELKAEGYLLEHYSKALGLAFLIKQGERGGWFTKEVDEDGEMFPDPEKIANNP